MLALTREIALPGLALLTAASLLLAGCGGAAQSKAGKGPPHPYAMFAPPAAPPGGEQDVVLRVGPESITRADYVHWAKALTPRLASYEPKSRADCSSVRAGSEVQLSRKELAKLSSAQIQALCIRQKQGQVRENVLKQLISSRWQIGEADELGVGVSEVQAQAQLAKDEAQQFKSRAEFNQYIQTIGRTRADITAEVRAQMDSERIYELIKRRVAGKVDEAAIARYYRAHKSSFEVPERRDIRAIRTWTHSAIANAMAEVRAGRSIAGVAERVSIDRPSNEHGGLIEGIVKGQEENGLDQAIFAAKLHALIGPLHLRARYYAFEVVKITPGRTKPYREIEAKVREALSEKLLEQEKAGFVAAFHRKWRARTSCSPGYVISRCRQWRGSDPFAGEELQLK